jgi:hypothetical protein
VLAGRDLKLLPEGGVLRQQINHAAQALERCQGNGVQRPLVCLGTRQGLGGNQGWDITQVFAASPHRPKLLGSFREELGGVMQPGAEKPGKLDARRDGYGNGPVTSSIAHYCSFIFNTAQSK